MLPFTSSPRSANASGNVSLVVLADPAQAVAGRWRAQGQAPGCKDGHLPLGGAQPQGAPNPQAPHHPRTLRPAGKVSPEIQALVFASLVHSSLGPQPSSGLPIIRTGQIPHAAATSPAHHGASRLRLSHPGREMTEVEVRDAVSAAQHLPVRSPPLVIVASTDRLPAGSGQRQNGNTADIQGRLSLK